MTMATEAAKLYRQLMKAARDWPIDTARRNRDLGAHIRKRISYDFRHLESGDVTGLERGRRELDAIVKLTSNYYKQKYTRVADIATTNQPRTLYASVLSDEGQARIKSGKRPGMLRSLWQRLTAKPTN